MSIKERVIKFIKNEYAIPKTRSLVVQFFAIAFSIAVFSLVIAVLIECTPFCVIVTGIHESGHASAAILTFSNLKNITIYEVFDHNNVNKSATLYQTFYDTTVVSFPIIAVSGALFAIILSAILVYAPCLRWFAPILGTGNFMQLVPWPGNDGYRALTDVGIIGVIVFLIAISIAILLYVLILFKLSRSIVQNQYIQQVMDKYSARLRIINLDQR